MRLLALCLSLLLALPVWAAETVGGIYDAARWANLNAAVADIGSTPGTLAIAGTLPAGANTTVPQTLTLEFRGAGVLTVANGITVTINSQIVSLCENRFALTGTGKVAFAIPVNVCPEWWGAVGGGANDTAAFTAALASLPYGGTPQAGKIILSGKVYGLKNWLVNKSGVIVQGIGAGYPGFAGATILQHITVASGEYTIGIPRLDANSDIVANVSVRDLQVYGNIVTNGTRFRLENVSITRGSPLAFAVDNAEPGDAGTLSDSADAGGLFGCAIYNAGIRIRAGKFTVADTYMVGNNTTTAITIEGSSASFTTVDTLIHNTFMEMYHTPVILVKNTWVSRTHLDNLRVGSSGGTGNLVTLVGGATIENSYFDAGGGGETRAIAWADGSPVTIRDNIFTRSGGGNWAGTTAPVLAASSSLSGAVYVRDRNGNQTNTGVEWNGYKGHTFEFDFEVASVGFLDSTGTYKLRGVRLVTTGATPTTIFALRPLQPDMIQTVKASVTGKRSPTGAFLYERSGAFLRDAQGRSSPVGYVVHNTTIESDPAAGVGLVLVRPEHRVEVQVKGIDGQRFDWLADVEWTVR